MLSLCAVAEIPVCSGSASTISGRDKHSIADFVHGNDGFGNKRPAQLSQVPVSLLVSKNQLFAMHVHGVVSA